MELLPYDNVCQEAANNNYVSTCEHTNSQSHQSTHTAQASSEGELLTEQEKALYTDYANEPEDHDFLQSIPAANRSLFYQPFPLKLHCMLSDAKGDGESPPCVSWQPHGRSFIVHNRKEFINHYLPSWFRHSKFSSFQRQLNLYGFRRVTTGRDKGGYYHELFLRGMPLLSYRMKRTKIKCNGPRKPACPHTEPNFYTMAFLPEEGHNSTLREWKALFHVAIHRGSSLDFDRLLKNNTSCCNTTATLEHPTDQSVDTAEDFYAPSKVAVGQSDFPYPFCTQEEQPIFYSYF